MNRNRGHSLTAVANTFTPGDQVVRGARLRWVVISGVVLLLLGAIPFLPPTAAQPGASNASTPNFAFPTPIHHVFVIYLENQPRSTVLSQGPFEAYLAQHYAQDSHYYGVCHPSAPNYLATTSGTPSQCGTDSYNVYTTTNLVNLFAAAGISNWTAYMQSMPSACDTSNAGIYVVHHNPFVYYKNVVGNRTYCDQHVVNLSQLNGSIANGTVPQFAWITPNNLDNSDNSSVATADHWLRGFLSPLVNDSFFRSSVFFVTYDESAKTDTSGYNGTTGGNVYFATVSPYARTGFDLTTDASHYNLLSTIEWLLGLGSTGHNDGTSRFPAMRSLFAFNGTPPPPPSLYPVSGLVTSSPATPPPGVSISWSNATNVTPLSVTPQGAFSTALPNGTYTFSAAAPGFQTESVNVTVQGAPVVGVVLNLTLASPPPGRYAVSGSVTSINGTVPSGVALSWSNRTNVTPVPMSAQGVFSTLLVNGTYMFSAAAPGFLTSTVNVTVQGAAVAGVVLNLTPAPSPPAPSVVTGVVYNASSGGVIAGASVLANNLTGSQVQYSDANGTFAFRLHDGTYSVLVNATGFDPLYTSWTLAAHNFSTRYDLNRSSSPDQPTNGTRSSANPVVVKVVTLGSTTGLSNATCAITNLGNNSVVVVTTDSHGLLHLDLSNGTYSLLIRSPGYYPAAIDLLVQGPQLVPLPVPLEPSRSSNPSGPGATGPAFSSIRILTVLSVMFVACVAALGATWIWATVQRPSAQRRSRHLHFRRRR